MNEVKITFYSEAELDLFIYALEGLRDTDSDGFTQGLIGKRITVSMCTTDDCLKKANLPVPETTTLQQYIDSIGTINIIAGDLFDHGDE